MPPEVFGSGMETQTGTLEDVPRAETSDGPISQQVVEAIADATGVDPLELPPLYDSVDPDALDSLFSHDGASASITSLCFEIGDCEVVVRGSGEVVVVRSDAELDVREFERQPTEDGTWDAVEDRCGIDLGENGRGRSHYC